MSRYCTRVVCCPASGKSKNRTLVTILIGFIIPILSYHSTPKMVFDITTKRKVWS